MALRIGKVCTDRYVSGGEIMGGNSKEQDLCTFRKTGTDICGGYPASLI